MAPRASRFWLVLAVSATLTKSATGCPNGTFLWSGARVQPSLAAIATYAGIPALQAQLASTWMYNQLTNLPGFSLDGRCLPCLAGCTACSNGIFACSTCNEG